MLCEITSFGELFFKVHPPLTDDFFKKDIQ